MTNRLLKVGLITTLPLCLMADGEYAKFHAGPMLGLGWSPSKSYKGYAGELTDGSGNTAVADGAGQFAPQMGLAMTYTFHPSQFRLGLDLDLLRTISKDSGTMSGIIQDPDGNQVGTIDEVGSVVQSIGRATLKCIWSFRANTHPSWYFWAGPSIAVVQTKGSVVIGGVSTKLDSNKTTLHGAGLGWGRRSISESSMGIFEINIQWLKKTDAGVNAGGVTLELRGGIQF